MIQIVTNNFFRKQTSIHKQLDFYCSDHLNRIANEIVDQENGYMNNKKFLQHEKKYTTHHLHPFPHLLDICLTQKSMHFSVGIKSAILTKNDNVTSRAPQFHFKTTNEAKALPLTCKWYI